MDICTKIFLLNWMAVIATCFIDKIMLGDVLQKTKVIGWLLGLWCFSTFLSTPVWFVWLIVSS